MRLAYLVLNVQNRCNINEKHLGDGNVSRETFLSPFFLGKVWQSIANYFVFRKWNVDCGQDKFLIYYETVGIIEKMFHVKHF